MNYKEMIDGLIDDRVLDGYESFIDDLGDHYEPQDRSEFERILEDDHGEELLAFLNCMDLPVRSFEESFCSGESDLENIARNMAEDTIGHDSFYLNYLDFKRLAEDLSDVYKEQDGFIFRIM